MQGDIVYSHRIKELLSRNQWSVYRLSKESGVSYSTLSNMLRRGTAPSAKTTEKICQAFCISTDDLISGAEERSDGLACSRADGFICSAEEKRLVKKFRKLSGRDRKMIYRLVDRL